MTALALIFTLAAIGVAETRYLISKRLAGSQPVCFIGTGCGKVLESKYNKILGIHNDLLGLFFYLVIGLLLAFLVLEISVRLPLNLVLLGLLIGGSLFSVYLTFLQSLVIKTWCFWCVGSALTIWLMTLIFFWGVF
jgi:uncharacterized membrane protein